MSAPTRMQKIEAMLAENQNDPELHYMLAMEHAGQGNDAAAVRCFERLMALAPNYPPAYHMAGRALQRLNRSAEARDVLKRGITIAFEAKDEHAAGEMRELMESLD